MRKLHEYTVIIEQDEEGWYVAEVPELKSCYTQARSLDELMSRVREAIALCLEVQKKTARQARFVGVQRISV